MPEIESEIPLDGPLPKEELDRAITVLHSQAGAVIVRDAQSYQYAGAFLMQIKERIAWVKQWWKKPKADANALHVSLCRKEKEMLIPLEAMQAEIDARMTAWRREQERLLGD